LTFSAAVRAYPTLGSFLFCETDPHCQPPVRLMAAFLNLSFPFFPRRVSGIEINCHDSPLCWLVRRPPPHSCPHFLSAPGRRPFPPYSYCIDTPFSYAFPRPLPLKERFLLVAPLLPRLPLSFSFRTCNLTRTGCLAGSGRLRRLLFHFFRELSTTRYMLAGF